MDISEPWGRLLWKEMRENILILATLILTPVVMLIVGPTRADGKLFSMIMVAPPAVIAVWAAGKARTYGRGRALVPISASMEWVGSFVFPLGVSVMAGAWFALMYGYLMLHGISREVIILGELLTATVYAISFSMSIGTVPIAGVLAGLGAGFVGSIPFMQKQVVQAVLTHSLPKLFLVFAGILAGCVLAGAVASIAYPAISRRGSTALARVCVVVLTVLVPVGAIVAIAWSDVAGQAETQYRYSRLRANVSGADGSMRIFLVGDERGERRKLKFESYRTGASAEREFDAAFAVLGIADDGNACIAQQKPGEESAAILIWNVASKRVWKVTEVPVGRNAVLDSIFTDTCSLSRDGRFAFLGTGSGIYKRHDLWLIDLKECRSRLLFAGRNFGAPDSIYSGADRFVGSQGVRYAGRIAYVYLNGDASAVDLETMTVSPVEVPRIEGGTR